MRHEQDCNCDRCQPSSSISDAILMGLLFLVGVTVAIMSGSKIIVAALSLLLITVAAVKIGLPAPHLPRSKRRK